MKQILFDIFSVVFKFVASAILSVVAYWYVLAYLHIEIYARLKGINKGDIWAGDSLLLLFQAIPMVILEFFIFYCLLSFIQKKLQRRNA